jgi:ATP-dependent RNA helicase RhlE
MSFQNFKLHPSVHAGVTEAGYTTPTPIQTQAIPTVLEGKDVMGLAQTGTGKTAAFALPILHRLSEGSRGHVRALIIAPTRELAQQINDSFRDLGKGTRLNSTVVYGGVGFSPQAERIRRGTEIVVACPGRLLDHMNQGTINLSKLEVLVLDEADQMFDMGFLPDIRRILAKLPASRQTLLFSATMPAEIRGLANDILRNPVTVQVDNVAPAATVSHALYPVSQQLKTPLLMELLQHTDTESVLIFTRTKHRAKRVGEQLVKAGYRAASIQGNLSQNRRLEAMDGFRDGRYQILVATDIAARGIDVSLVSHVINYDIPDTTEAYIHRIGRTGRAAKSGDAFTFVTDEDGPMVRGIEKVLKSTIERRKLDGFNYAAVVPRHDDEFARPPRQPQHRKPAAAPKAAARPEAKSARSGFGKEGGAGKRPVPQQKSHGPGARHSAGGQRQGRTH